MDYLEITSIYTYMHACALSVGNWKTRDVRSGNGKTTSCTNTRESAEGLLLQWSPDTFTIYQFWCTRAHVACCDDERQRKREKLKQENKLSKSSSLEINLCQESHRKGEDERGRSGTRVKKSTMYNTFFRDWKLWIERLLENFFLHQNMKNSILYENDKVRMLIP